MPAFCVLHNFEFNLDLRQMPGCGNSSSKGDILPGGDENVFWLERFCSYHCLPGIRKCLWNMIAERESFKIQTQVPARPRKFRPREKDIERSTPTWYLLSATLWSQCLLYPFSSTSHAPIWMNIIQIKPSMDSVCIFPSLNQTVSWLSALDHTNHHNEREMMFVLLT